MCDMTRKIDLHENLAVFCDCQLGRVSLGFLGCSFRPVIHDESHFCSVHVLP